MTTDDPQITNEGAQQSQGPAVVVYEITDPGAAGEEIEILDQGVVHLGSEPFRGRRVVVNLDQSMFVYHSVSHRIRTRTRLHPADPETSTVSKIAVNWGFWHFGEFAAAYKICFDEMPSETLNQ